MNRSLYLMSALLLVFSIPGCGVGTGGGGDGGSDGGSSSRAQDLSIDPSTFPVYRGPTLSPGFDLILNSSGNLTNWLMNDNGYFEAQYPAGQQFGFIAVTTYPATANIQERKPIDLSTFNNLLVDMKGAKGGESVDIGVKTESDPDNGQDPKLSFQLTSSWQTYQVPLQQLVSATYPASRFTHLYVVCEFVFEPGVQSETIFFKNILYAK